MKINKLLISTTIMITIGSCSEDMLDIEPQGRVISSSIDLNTDEPSALKALIAAYAPVVWQYPWGMSFYLESTIASDEAVCGGASASDRPEYLAADLFSYNSLNPGAQQLWDRYCSGIYRCNLFLENTDKTKSNVINTYRAHAKFLRAYYYFHFVRLFGKVPLVLTIAEASALPTRAPLKDIYEQMEKDLIEAIPYLSTNTSDYEKEMGFASKGAAQGLLGKIYVYHSTLIPDDKKWDEAFEQLNAVVSSGVYSLEPDFGKLWRTDFKIKDGNKEAIFEAVYTDQFAPDYSGHHQGNQDIQMMGIRSLTFAEGFPSPYLGGWGFAKVTKSLVDAFIAENDTFRLRHTVIFADSLLAHGASFNDVFDYTGYYNNKYACRSEFSPVQVGMWAQNETVMRLAEIYLLLAETEYKRGNEVAALKYVNDIRSRAKLNLKSSSGAQLWNDIVTEKRLELALEAQRYWDITRWGIAESVLGNAGYTKEKELLPIPKNELTINPNLVQNPGY